MPGSAAKTYSPTPRGDWARVIDVDLTAVIDATRIAVREMRWAGQGGVIINTAPLIGLVPMASAPVSLPRRQAWSIFHGRAIEIARRQSAKSWELRATISLARLLGWQGRRNEARTLLAGITAGSPRASTPPI